MLERESNVPEMAPERVPTPEEVHAKLRELMGKEYKVMRELSDERGLYLLEVEIPGGSEGEITEYAYMREGRYKESAISGTEIYVTYYRDGIATSGTSVARYIGGGWIIL